MAAVVSVMWCEGGQLREGSSAELNAARATGPVWVDVTDPDEASLTQLGAELGLHPLAIEDCLHHPQRQKIDTYGDSAFIVWSFLYLTEANEIAFPEVDVFLGAGYLVTVHEGAASAIEEATTEAGDALCKGVDWMLHAILDRAVDDVFPVVDYISDTLDTLEDRLLGRPDTGHLHGLYAVKRKLVGVHRAITAQRDIMRGLARHQQYVSQDAYLYFQDIGDHLARAADSVDTYRDVASGAMDIYLTSVNNRMNEIMKQLTVVATIFMPLTLLSGIYGMNLLGPGGRGAMWPPPDSRWGFFAVIGFMAAISVWMLWFFRRRKWW